MFEGPGTANILVTIVASVTGNPDLHVLQYVHMYSIQYHTYCTVPGYTHTYIQCTSYIDTGYIYFTTYVLL